MSLVSPLCSMYSNVHLRNFRLSKAPMHLVLSDSNINVNSMINRRVSLFYRYPLKAFHHMACPCTLVGVCVVCPGTSELVGQHLVSKSARFASVASLVTRPIPITMASLMPWKFIVLCFFFSVDSGLWAVSTRDWLSQYIIAGPPISMLIFLSLCLRAYSLSIVE